MLANWITLSRFPLLLLSVLILYFGSATLRLAGVALLFLGLMLDTVDGMVARKTGQTSLFGSVLDIAADRTYEARATLTDAFRSIGVGQGKAPFAQHRTALGRFLVGSTPMRTGYAVTKTATFCGLALAQAFAGFPSGSPVARVVPPMMTGLQVTAWLAVLFCVFRGLPVIIHSLRTYWGKPASPPSRTSP